MNSDRLTDPGTKLGRNAAKTPPGMAYFVGTGPSEATCGTCEFFLGKIKLEGVGVGELQHGRCSEFIRMMKSKGYSSAPNYRLSPETAACRYHEIRIKPRPGEKQAAATT